MKGQSTQSSLGSSSQCVFIYTLVLWQDLVPGDLTGDQLTGPLFLHWSKVAHPRDGAAEKEFFLAFPSLPTGKKSMIFCHCDHVMHM